MLTDHPSRTAMLVAAYRARASERTQPICSDAYARSLAGDEGFAFAAEMDEVAPQMELWIALRTAYLDEVVSQSDAGQVVLLGAGFDSRPLRLAREGRHFFVVDAPASLAERRARWARLGPSLGTTPPPRTSEVECDFERQDFVDALVAEGFDPESPAIVIWEGVSYYLTEAAVRATLSRVAEALHPESEIVFDHVGARFVADATDSAGDKETRERIARRGEPMIWGTNDILPLLFELGYRRARLDRFDEVCLRFTGTYERSRAFRFQHLVRASVNAPVDV